MYSTDSGVNFQFPPSIFLEGDLQWLFELYSLVANIGLVIQIPGANSRPISYLIPMEGMWVAGQI